MQFGRNIYTYRNMLGRYLGSRTLACMFAANTGVLSLAAVKVRGTICGDCKVPVVVCDEDLISVMDPAPGRDNPWKKDATVLTGVTSINFAVEAIFIVENPWDRDVSILMGMTLMAFKAEAIFVADNRLGRDAPILMGVPFRFALCFSFNEAALIMMETPVGVTSLDPTLNSALAAAVWDRPWLVVSTMDVSMLVVVAWFECDPMAHSRNPVRRKGTTSSKYTL
jgi:hypothetical protein